MKSGGAYGQTDDGYGAVRIETVVLKINRKPIHMHALDGAAFPYIIKVEYTVDGRTYTKRKWIAPGEPVPAVGSQVQVLYRADKPSAAKIR